MFAGASKLAAGNVDRRRADWLWRGSGFRGWLHRKGPMQGLVYVPFLPSLLRWRGDGKLFGFGGRVTRSEGMGVICNS